MNNILKLSKIVSRDKHETFKIPSVDYKYNRLVTRDELFRIL